MKYVIQDKETQRYVDLVSSGINPNYTVYYVTLEERVKTFTTALLAEEFRLSYEPEDREWEIREVQVVTKPVNISSTRNTVTHQFVLSVTVQESSPENVLALRDKILHKLKDDQDLLSENFNYISDMSIKAL